MMKRSIYGLIYAFNMLPADVVDLASVSAFQSRLQSGVKKAIEQGVLEWQSVI